LLFPGQAPRRTIVPTPCRPIHTAIPSLSRAASALVAAAVLLVAAAVAKPSSAAAGSTAAGPAAVDGSSPLLLRKPALGPVSICFAYGGDLWLVGRDGGAARR
jgi:hypothetical protein